MPSEGNSITFTDVGRDNLKQIIKDGISLDDLLLKEFESENMSINNIKKKLDYQSEKTSVINSHKNSTSQSSNNWEYNRNKQVTIKNNNICFGFHNVANKGKYKYTYNMTNYKFYEIDENNNQKEIDIKSIHLYDLLSLYEFAKKQQQNKSYTYLIEEIKSIIKPNTLKKFGKTFLKLGDSNFDKTKNNSNFGKFKKKTIGFKKEVELNSTGTTYIFFKLKNESFEYACFRDGEKAFYYTKDNINNKLQLNELNDEDALKDLVVYILLIRILYNKPDFAEVILNQARSNLSRKFNNYASTQSTTLNGVS